MRIVDRGTNGLARALAAALAFAIACGAGTYAYLDARIAAQVIAGSP